MRQGLVNFGHRSVMMLILQTLIPSHGVTVVLRLSSQTANSCLGNMHLMVFHILTQGSFLV
jgi:hypothetical protein